jgi:hypothetical protein
MTEYSELSKYTPSWKPRFCHEDCEKGICRAKEVDIDKCSHHCNHYFCTREETPHRFICNFCGINEFCIETEIEKYIVKTKTGRLTRSKKLPWNVSDYRGPMKFFQSRFDPNQKKEELN